MAVTFECFNFRDYSNSFPDLIRPGLIYRGGSVAFCSWESVGRPATVINLRFEADEPRWAGVNYVHCPIENAIEKYDTSNPQVMHWLLAVIQVITAAKTPILLHCRSGRDRTGVVSAVLLRILLGSEYDRRIVQDYTLSTGAQEAFILISLQGLEKQNRKGTFAGDQWIQSYFREKKFPIEYLRRKFLLSST